MKKGTDYIGVGCGALIINNKNEILLVRRTSKTANESSFWSLPGGSVDFGEKVVDAIKREIKEELGVEIELTKFLGYHISFLGQSFIFKKNFLRGFNFLRKFIAHPSVRNARKLAALRHRENYVFPDPLSFKK